MGIKTVPQPPYSPDLAPCDFWLFPKLRGCRYETTEEMKEAVTMVIDTLRQEDFHGALQKLLERYKCISAGGDYFEGDNSFMCVLSIKVPIRKKSGNLINNPLICIFSRAFGGFNGCECSFPVWVNMFVCVCVCVCVRERESEREREREPVRVSFVRVHMYRHVYMRVHLCRHTYICFSRVFGWFNECECPFLVWVNMIVYSCVCVLVYISVFVRGYSLFNVRLNR